jgi:hypothetical protein
MLKKIFLKNNPIFLGFYQRISYMHPKNTNLIYVWAQIFFLQFFLKVPDFRFYYCIFTFSLIYDPVGKYNFVQH